MHSVSRGFHIIFFGIILLLSNCAHYNHYVKTQQEGKVCRQACHEKQRVCQRSCYNNCPLCCAKQNSDTQISYDRYKHQQIIQGQAIIRQLKSYRDPLQCSKISCDCVSDHATCLQSCTKKTPKQLQLSPSC